MRAMFVATMLLLSGCALTQKAELKKGMTYREVNGALNPVSTRYVDGARDGQDVSETYLVESWPCVAESYTYRLIYRNGLLDEWSRKRTVPGDALIVCKGDRVAIATPLVDR